MSTLRASVVLYRTRLEEIESISRTLQSGGFPLDFIDNSPDDSLCEHCQGENVTYTHLPENLGYGAGHNVSITRSLSVGARYHLALNSDIEFTVESLQKMIAYMEEYTDVGHLMPRILGPDGEVQYLCKLVPTPMDLIGRRFLPALPYMERRNRRFELRFADYKRIMNVPYLSGCFMLLRVDALREVGLFDERYFLYPEDIDLTRRIHRRFRTIYFPDTSVVHQHRRDSYRSLRVLLIHMREIIRYFNKWGWFFDRERRSINRAVINAIRMDQGECQARKDVQ